MRKGIRETQISIKDPEYSYGAFEATVRDKELVDIDDMKGGKSSPMPTVEKLKAYIQFLQEVIQAMEED